MIGCLLSVASFITILWSSEHHNSVLENNGYLSLYRETLDEQKTLLTLWNKFYHIKVTAVVGLMDQIVDKKSSVNTTMNAVFAPATGKAINHQ